MNESNNTHPLQQAATLRLLAAALELQHLTSLAANVVPIPGGERVIAIGTADQVREVLAAPVAGQQAAPVVAMSDEQDMLEAIYPPRAFLKREDWDATTRKPKARAAASQAAPEVGADERAELPTNEAFEELWNNHAGHPADFGAAVLEQWGGWQDGLLGYGGALNAKIAPPAPAQQATDNHLPGWERGIATVTMNGHQLREALEFINPSGDDDPDERENELTFGIVAHKDDDGKEATGLCCWNDDTDGVLPLDDEPAALGPRMPTSKQVEELHHAALAAPAQQAGAEAGDALRLIRDTAKFDATASGAAYYRIAENALAAIEGRDATPPEQQARAVPDPSQPTNAQSAPVSAPTADADKSVRAAAGNAAVHSSAIWSAIENYAYASAVYAYGTVRDDAAQQRQAKDDARAELEALLSAQPVAQVDEQSADPWAGITTVDCPTCAGNDGHCDDCDGQGQVIVSRADLEAQHGQPSAKGGDVGAGGQKP